MARWPRPPKSGPTARRGSVLASAAGLLAGLALVVGDAEEAVAVITVNLTMDEARAVAGAIQELVERSELNELILGPIDWDDLRTARSKLTKAIDDQS